MEKRLPTWREMIRDTDFAVASKQIELYQSLPPAERFARMRGLNRMVRRLAMEGLKARFPDASESELNYRFVVAYYGKDIAEQFLLPTNSQ